MFNKRYIVFLVFLIIISGLLIFHYARLMITEEPTPPRRSSAGLPERGSIFDRNGRFLAVQIRFNDVTAWKPDIPKPGNNQKLPDLQDIANELSPILEMTPSEILSKIESTESNFVFIKKRIDDSTARRVSAIINEKNIAGINLQPIVGRVYPEGKLASQVIGFTGDKNNGLEGIEYALNDVLNGVDNDGAGSNVVLTIDTYVQHILEEISFRTMEENGAEAVIFVAMDPRTGDILGSVSMPDFDPNFFNLSDSNSRMNRPAIWAFEPGSTFKIFSLAALLDAGAISANTAFNCNGSYTLIKGAPITCLSSHGRVTPREIIISSCNVGAAYASDFINSNTFYRLLSDFGFGARTRAGVPGETVGYLVPSLNWSDRSRQTIAFGQEIAVSAYQILQAASVIANDGILVPPRIVLKHISADGLSVTDIENGERRRVLKEQTARTMRSYMVDTAASGAMGWRASVQDLSLGVKTGTSQIIDPVTRRYSETDFIASCIALLPAENPSLILYMAIVKPKGIIYGARIAAPAIREAAEALIDYIGIPRGRNPQISHPSAINITTGRLPAIETIVPDFTGLSKRALLPLLLREDINVEILGDGWVRRQSPPFGAPIENGMTIILALE